MNRSPAFWFALIACFFAGLYGFFKNEWVVFIPYMFINPFLLILLTSFRPFSAIRKKLELLGAVAVFINIPGSLYLHKLGIQYDIPLHLIAGWIGFQVCFLTFPVLFKKEGFSFLTLILAVFLGGLIFEGIQNLSDILFGTNLAYDVIQAKQTDLFIDISMNALGAVFAALFKRSSKPAS